MAAKILSFQRNFSQSFKMLDLLRGKPQAREPAREELLTWLTLNDTKRT